MTNYSSNSDGLEYYEYHGNTAIEHIRRQRGRILREWLYFDSTEEAVEFYNDQCACLEAVP